MDPRQMRGFLSEMEKIAEASPGMGIMKRAFQDMFMAGMGLHPAGRVGAIGKLNMGLTGLATAAQLPGVLRKEDPTGQGRNRVERVGQFLGSTIGSALPTGYLALKHPNMSGWKSVPLSLGLGMAGAVAGGALGSIPGRLLGRRPAPVQPASEQPVAPQPGVPA